MLEMCRCCVQDRPAWQVENIVAIAEVLADYPDIPLVLDPVLLRARRRAGG